MCCSSQVCVCVQLWPSHCLSGSVDWPSSPALEDPDVWSGRQSPPPLLRFRSVARTRVGRIGLRWPSSAKPTGPPTSPAGHVSLVTWPEPARAANSVAVPVSSCSGKTFQQMASDCSRNICNVRHWWESIPPAASEHNFKITELLN